MPQQLALYRYVMSCVICSHRWVALFREGTKELSCPECGYMNGAPPTAPDATA